MVARELNPAPLSPIVAWDRFGPRSTAPNGPSGMLDRWPRLTIAIAATRICQKNSLRSAAQGWRVAAVGRTQPRSATLSAALQRRRPRRRSNAAGRGAAPTPPAEAPLQRRRPRRVTPPAERPTPPAEAPLQRRRPRRRSNAAGRGAAPTPPAEAVATLAGFDTRSGRSIYSLGRRRARRFRAHGAFSCL